MNAQCIKDRTIDAWVAPRAMVIHAVREVRGDLELVQFVQVIRGSGLWLAASRSLPDEQARHWQEAWASMTRDGSAERIIRRHLHPKVDDPLDHEKRRIREEPFR